MTLKDSQRDMYEHSAKKVELLQRYLTEYLAVVSNDRHTQAVHCFDLFCGEGIYPNGGTGSPIVFHESLLDCATKHPDKQFFFHFNDAELSKVEQVKSLIHRSQNTPKNLTVSSSNAAFDKIVQDTKHKLAELKKGKAFLFIDPYGYTEIKPPLLRELMKGGNSEVLLFLPMQQMFRFSEKGTPPVLAEFLEEIRHGRPFPTGKNVADYLAYLVNGFRFVVPDCIVDSFTIRKDVHTTYCLFFFTTNLKGAEKMLEAKWKLDETQGLGWSWEANLSADSLFNEPITNPLELILEEKLRSPKSNADIYDFTIRAGFLPTHALQILQTMQQEGRIVIKPERIRKGAFYLNYAATFGADTNKHRPITIQLK